MNPLLLGGILTTFVLSVVAGYLTLRLALILPAAALEKPMSIGDAWFETSKFKNAILILLLCQLVIETVTELVLVAMPGESGLQVLWETSSFLLVALLNVSILTTMYGVFIEKRELT